MDKRYQVFISSTYEDLKEERSSIIQVLWELNCIPYGMEVFPATNNSSWEWIERAIRESDYFILILGGKYGSIHPSGISYTQKEYEFAKSIGIPSISFIVNEDILLANKIEKDSFVRQKLEEFKALVKIDKGCRFYKSPDDLSKQVSTSLQQLIKDNPRIGWIRGDNSLTDQVSLLKKEIRDLKEKQKQSKTTLTYKGLPNGENDITLIYNCEYVIKGEKSYSVFRHHYKGNTEMSWNEIFYNIGSFLMTTDHYSLSYHFDSKNPFQKTLYDKVKNQIEKEFGISIERLNINIEASFLQTVFLELLSLRCVTKSGEYWRITNTGMRYLSSIKENYKSKIDNASQP